MKNVAVLLCVLCVPWLCTVLWGNAGLMMADEEAAPAFADAWQGRENGIHFLTEDHGWYGESMDMEEYVAGCLAEYGTEDLNIEAAKALAVVLRTEIEGGQVVIPYREASATVPERFRDVAEVTRGIILTYQGSPAHALWTNVSNGTTRDGTENRLASAAYLKKRVCKKDILSDEYSTEVAYGKKKYEEILTTLLGDYVQENELPRDDFGWPVFVQIRDSAGYTRKIIVGTKEIEGSDFSDAFLLKSPSFDMEYQDGRVVFHVTGCGHGFGMSLYAADRMAEEGKDFMEILSFFYPGTELGK